MKNSQNNKIASRWLIFSTLLVVAYFVLVNPFYHLHYFHQNGSLAIETSSVTNKVDITHSTDHHHHDGESSHTDDHQHAFNQHINWHISRTQTLKIFSYDDQYFFSSISYIVTNQDNLFYFDYEELQDIDEYYVSYLIIRGPPPLV